MPTTMRLQLNGDTAEVRHGISVAELVAELGRDPRTLAIEHNGAIVPRDRYATVVLTEGDQLEVVHFVQGG